MKRYLCLILAAVCLGTVPSCTTGSANDPNASAYAAIDVAQAAVTIAEAALKVEAARPNADPLKIAAAMAAVDIARTQLARAQARLSATPPVALPVSSAKAVYDPTILP